MVLHETERVQRGSHNHAHGDANSQYAAGSIGILAQSESGDRTSVLQACGEPGQDEGKNTPPNRLEGDCAGQYGPIEPSRQIERADREVVEGTIRRRCECREPDYEASVLPPGQRSRQCKCRNDENEFENELPRVDH